MYLHASTRKDGSMWQRSMIGEMSFKDNLWACYLLYVSASGKTGYLVRSNSSTLNKQQARLPTRARDVRKFRSKRLAG